LGYYLNEEGKKYPNKNALSQSELEAQNERLGIDFEGRPLKKKKMETEMYGSRAGSVASSTLGMTSHSGYDGDAVPVGSKSKISTCKRVYGSNRRMNLNSVVKDMLNEQEIGFQTLNQPFGQNWKIACKNPLNMRWIVGGENTWTEPIGRSLWFPVYIYRLSCPIGNQTNQGTGGFSEAWPVVQYRLQGSQEADGDEWFYTWAPWDVANNMDETYPTRNTYNSIVEESLFTCQKFYHEYSTIKALFTAPTEFSQKIDVNLVTFNNDFVPPDQYIPNGTGTITTFRADILDTASTAARNEWYTNWLFNKMCHPCISVKNPPGLVGPRPFNILQKHRMVLNIRDTTAAGTFGNSYVHTQVYKPHKWYNAVYPHITQQSEGPDVDPFGKVFQKRFQKRDNSGVFPEPDKQVWLMISADQAYVGPINGAIAPTQEASFDIAIRSNFKCAQV